MALSIPSPLVFSVKRRNPEFVRPAKPTPREVKQLSEIDDQEGLRFQIPVIMFYPNSPLMEGKDPVKVIREALGKTLVYYYPFAGRLIEGENRNLMVDCSGEGVLFIEADADTTLENLGDAILPICPCFEELLYDVPGSGDILGSPLFLIQVTRLKCGGFVFGLRLNHTMTDAPGLFQFLNAVTDMAQGLPAPSLLPVWERELLNARNPPRITRTHYEYEKVVTDALMPMDENNLVHQSFFFGLKGIRALRNRLPTSFGACSTFEVLAACIWRCRTIAFAVDPDEIVRFSCVTSIRGKHGFDLPPGYYGNAFVFPAVITKAGMLCTYPLEYGIRLVKEAKAKLSKEYVKSVADLMVMEGRRPSYMTPAGNYLVSDLTPVGLGEVDFGWGKPVFAGVARAIPIASFCMRFKNRKGEEGIVVPICLPPSVMERFEQELKRLTEDARLLNILTSML